MANRFFEYVLIVVVVMVLGAAGGIAVRRAVLEAFGTVRAATAQAANQR